MESLGLFFFAKLVIIFDLWKKSTVHGYAWGGGGGGGGVVL
jgi:hypothetical protein